MRHGSTASAWPGRAATALSGLSHFTGNPTAAAAAGTAATQLHTLQSDLVKVFVGPGSEPHEVVRIESVGAKAHGVVAWGRDLLMLDSDNGALVTVDVETGDVYDLYMVSQRPQRCCFVQPLHGESTATALLLCSVVQRPWHGESTATASCCSRHT